MKQTLIRLDHWDLEFICCHSTTIYPDTSPPQSFINVVTNFTMELLHSQQDAPLRNPPAIAFTPQGQIREYFQFDYNLEA